MGLFSGGVGGILKDVFDIINGKWILDQLLNSPWILERSNDFWNSMGDKTYVGGYEYYMGMHVGVCHGPVDSVIRLRFASRTAWAGNVVPTTPDASGQIVINKASFWGGRNPGNGGGLIGIIDVMFGADDQLQNEYLVTQLGTDNVPGYRGKLTMVMRGDRTSQFQYYNEFLKEFWTGVYEARKAKLSEPPTHHTGFLWSARQKQVANMDVTVIRRLKGWYSDTVWESSLAAIGSYDMNPAHMLYECLTNRRWGMRRNASFVDTSTTFLAAAQRLYNENFGLSMVWTGQDSIENFIGQILKHIDASLPFNPVTGLFELRLVRGLEDTFTLNGNHGSGATTVVVNETPPIDIPTAGTLRVGSTTVTYTSLNSGTKTFTLSGTLGVAYLDDEEVFVPNVDVDELVHLTVDDVIEDQMGTFSRVVWGETVNQVTVAYVNPDNEQQEVITRQDLANIAIQGEVVPTSIQFPGIRNRELAARVCERELRSVCSTLGRISDIRFTRRAGRLVEGMLCRITIEEYGLDDVIFRVGKAKQGSLTDGSVSLDLIEDVFSLPNTAFAEVPETVWSNPMVDPADIVNTKFFTVPYHVLVQRSANLANIASRPNAAYVGFLAERPAPQNQGLIVYADIDATPSGSVRIASGMNCPTAVLQTTTGKYDTTIRYNTPNNLDPTLLPGVWFFLDDEKISVVSVVAGSGYWDLTVKRAVLDTVPAAHTSGAKLWFYNSSAGAIYLNDDFQAGDTPYFFIVGSSSIGESDIDLAPVLHPTVDASWNAPYPPANVLINGELEPTDALSGFTVTWNGRNKVSQDTVLVGWTESHVAPEPGTLYTLEVRNGATNALISTHTDLECGETGGSYTFYDQPNAAPYYKISLWATLNGVASTVYTYTAADKSGFGYNFGYMYGGRSLGVVLDPGETLPEASTLYDQTPMATYINGKWRHFNFDAAADVSYGVRTIAIDESIMRSSVDDGVTWTTDNISTAADRPLSAKVVLFANTRYVAIGGKYLWHKTDAAANWTRVDTSTLVNSYAGSGDVDSCTYDGSLYVVSINKGKDVYTSSNLSSWTRKGTTGSPNTVTLLMDPFWIGYLGSNYIAVGYDAYGDPVTASSSDLLAWTVVAGAPAMLTNPNDWVYFASEWYAFGTYGDAVTGRIVCYKTSDGVTWTAVDMASPMHTPLFGHPFITTTGISVFGGPYIFETPDGAAWTKTRCTFNPILAAFARTRAVLNSTETPPDIILLRTGVRSEDFTKDATYVGNARKGKLLSVTGWSDTDAALVYPAGATYAEKIGALGDFSTGISDAGFLIQQAAVDTAGFRGRSSGKRYFEITIADIGPLQPDPTCMELGVCLAAGGSETFITSSAMLDGVGQFYTQARIACPGGVIGSSETPVKTSFTPAVGSVIGVLCDFTAKTITLKHNNVNIAQAAVSDIPTSLGLWYPVFTGNSATLIVNLGQSSFTYTQSGYTGWNT